MTISTPVYDSAQRRLPFAELRHFWEYRGLIRLLATRDLTVRYKRSVLGVWWTLLNPMFMVLVFWVVFSQLFGRQAGDVPFIVYLTTGILAAQYFTQGIIATGSAIVGSSSILVKVHVPPEVFSLAAGVAAAFNFLISLIPLIIMQIITGVGVPWTFGLVLLSTLAMLVLVTGLGLVVASAAVSFYDVFDLVRVLALLTTYLAATFYPLSIVPDGFVWIIKLNPLFHHIEVFRAFAFGAELGVLNVAAVVASTLVSLWLGIALFSRSWKNVVVTL